MVESSRRIYYSIPVIVTCPPAPHAVLLSYARVAPVCHVARGPISHYSGPSFFFFCWSFAFLQTLVAVVFFGLVSSRCPSRTGPAIPRGQGHHHPPTTCLVVVANYTTRPPRQHHETTRPRHDGITTPPSVQSAVAGRVSENLPRPGRSSPLACRDTNIDSHRGRRNPNRWALHTVVTKQSDLNLLITPPHIPTQLSRLPTRPF